jgi:hypothetical protein
MTTSIVSEKPIYGSLLSDDRSDISDRGVSKWIVRFVLRAMSCLPLLRRLPEEEVRSFPQRIKAAREITLGFSSGSPVLPKELECFSVSGPSSHIRAYRQDMQRLKDRFPFVTTQDLYLATLAWKLGTQNRGRSSCSESDRSTLSTSLAPEARQSYAAPSSSAIDQM